MGVFLPAGELGGHEELQCFGREGIKGRRPPAHLVRMLVIAGRRVDVRPKLVQNTFPEILCAPDIGARDRLGGRNVRKPPPNGTADLVGYRPRGGADFLHIVAAAQMRILVAMLNPRLQVGFRHVWQRRELAPDKIVNPESGEERADFGARFLRRSARTLLFFFCFFLFTTAALGKRA